MTEHLARHASPIWRRHVVKSRLQFDVLALASNVSPALDRSRYVRDVIFDFVRDRCKAAFYNRYCRNKVLPRLIRQRFHKYLLL